MPNWEQALKACQDQKASLVSIHSEEEYTFVKNLTAHSMFFWIGLNDKATEGMMFYITFHSNLIVWQVLWSYANMLTQTMHKHM